jgi:Protein of unknown function (DUF551)
MDDIQEKMNEAIRNIAYRHREILDDWCKAYLAQRYEEGEEIKPGNFTLNEQMWDENGKMGKRYWFTDSVPNYPKEHMDTVSESGTYGRLQSSDDLIVLPDRLNEINAQKFMSKFWIKCSDRMPDESEWILLSDILNGMVTTGILFEGIFVDPNIDYIEIIGVTHWMPLPNAPEESVDDKMKSTEIIHSEWGCYSPISFNTKEGIQRMEPRKIYDKDLNILNSPKFRPKRNEEME